MVGPGTYNIWKNQKKSFEQLKEKLTQHFRPRPSEVVQRFRLNSRVRKEGESVREYVAELRHFAEFCNFGVTLETMIRDCLVCDIRDESIQRKLLSEKGLTYERAVTLAEEVETATHNLLEINPVSGGIKREPMNIVSEREPIQRTLGASGLTCHCSGVTLLLSAVL